MSEKTKLKVLIADGLAKEGIENLKKNPLLDVLEFSAIERPELKEKLPSIDILVVRSRTTVDKDLLENGRNLKIVLRAGIGLDNVDVPAATDRGVVVMNAPTGNIVTTAEHAIAMIFASTRHIPHADASIRQGKWEKKKFQGNELRGKTLGLIGLGNIGKTVADRASALQMKVIGFDPFVTKEAAAKNKILLVSIEEVISQSDYLSLHVPLTPGTKNLINKETLSKMKKGAYLINCARGGIVDETALMESLKSGHLNGAALDVFETEPLPAHSPLLNCPNLVLTPHLGASTDEAQVQVGLEVAEQLLLYSRDGVLKNAVNVPNITLEQLNNLKPYITLCERIGGFAGQLTTADKIQKISVKYLGGIGESNREVLTLSVLQGFLSPVLSTPVNFVNARKLLKERGINLQESAESECTDYNSIVEITLEGNNQTLSVSGTLFGKEEPRIVSIDNFKIDAIPQGHLLFTRNTDQPGVIGAMGSTLGNQGVNIARMHLGRDPKKGEAIALINIDSEPSAQVLDLLRKIKGMLLVKNIKL